MLKTIAQEWELFQRMVVPTDASSIQQEEMKKAFYLGARAMLQGSAQIGEDPRISLEMGAAQLQAWEDEVRAFVMSLLEEGRWAS